MEKDEYMRYAIALAKKGIGAVDPNPLVGAVIVKDGKIIGEGYHQRFGGLHAERNALASCTDSPKGATLFVTLEPCCHYGKTPPCTEAILEAGIKRVIIGSRDPNPKVAGKGSALLQKAGIVVEEDFLREECDAINAPFFHYISTGRPYVAMKYAMTADGKIASFTGASQWITNEESRHHVHRLRNRYQGILVGIGTVLADDPLLTCRIPNGRNPIRIICDTHLCTPLQSKLVQTAKDIPLLIATCSKDMKKQEELKQAGAEILEFQGDIIPLDTLMEVLGKRQIGSILLEGGGTLNGSFLEAGLVQRLYTYVGAKVLGGTGAKSPIGGKGLPSPDCSPALLLQEVKTCGDDILCVYNIEKE